jgi:riboflavin transporter FmnP
MNDLTKLGKTTEIIGKSVFYILIIAISILGIGLTLIKYEHRPEKVMIIASLIGTLLVLVIAFFLLRVLFRPIYNLNKNLKLRLNEELTAIQFKTKWTISLICSLIFGLVFIIGTFGISFLAMIPQYILLFKTKGI